MFLFLSTTNWHQVIAGCLPCTVALDHTLGYWTNTGHCEGKPESLEQTLTLPSELIIQKSAAYYILSHAINRRRLFAKANGSIQITASDHESLKQKATKHLGGSCFFSNGGVPLPNLARCHCSFSLLPLLLNHLFHLLCVSIHLVLITALESSALRSIKARGEHL